jgi:hypothetical protein
MSLQRFPRQINGGLTRLNRSAGVAAPFSPLDIAGLQLWYDLSDTSTLFQDDAKTTAVTADGDVIGYIADKSLNGYDVSQSVTGNKPVWKAAIKNGLGGGLFNGTSNRLERAVSDWEADATSGYVVAVFRQERTTAARILLSSGDQGSNTRFWIIYQEANLANVILVRNNDTASRYDVGYAPAQDYYVFTYTSDGSVYSIRRNGVPQTVISFGGAAGRWISSASSRDNIVLGSYRISAGYGEFFRGFLCEVVAAKNYSLANIQLLENYMAAKWAT